jgi:hypothetical protein
MTEPAQTSDVFTDEALLDRVGAGADAGADPVAGLLGALATIGEEPIGPRRSPVLAPVPAARRHRLGGRRSMAAAALVAVALSGAGVAAALTLPDLGSPAPAHSRTTRTAKPGAPPIPQQAGRPGRPPVRPSTAPSTPSSGAVTGLPPTGTLRPSGSPASPPSVSASSVVPKPTRTPTQTRSGASEQPRSTQPVLIGPTPLPGAGLPGLVPAPVSATGTPAPSGSPKAPSAALAAPSASDLSRTGVSGIRPGTATEAEREGTSEGPSAGQGH